MLYSSHGRFRQQFRFLCRQFLQDGGLPFSNILSEELVWQALEATGACWLERIYTPLVTLWVFLGQVLSQDHSCRAAVAKLIANSDPIPSRFLDFETIDWVVGGDVVVGADFAVSISRIVDSRHFGERFARLTARNFLHDQIGVDALSQSMTNRFDPPSFAFGCFEFEPVEVACGVELANNFTRNTHFVGGFGRVIRLDLGDNRLLA